MKKSFVLFVTATLIMVVGVTSILAGSNPKGKPFIAINDQIVVVENSLSSLQDQIDLLVGKVDSMEGRLAASEAAVQTLTNQNSSISALIYSNITNVEGINSEIAFLNSEIANLQSMLQDVGGIDPALEAQIADNTAMVNSLSAAIAGVNGDLINLEGDLQGQIDNNNDLIVGLQSQVAQINADLALKQNIVNGLCFDGEAIQEILPDGSVVCGEAGGGMSGGLEIVYTWKQVVLDNNVFVQTEALCPDGYSITGAGYASAVGWEIDAIFTEIGVLGNYAKLLATNRNGFRDNILAVASCMRIAP